MRPFTSLSRPLLLTLAILFAAATAAYSITYPSPELWKAPLSDFGAAYYAALTVSWLIWMLLFGIYFPEVFEQRSWRERLSGSSAGL